MRCLAESVHTFHDGAATLAAMQASRRILSTGLKRGGTPEANWRTGECLRRDEANRVDTDSACALDVRLHVIDKHPLLTGYFESFQRRRERARLRLGGHHFVRETEDIEPCGNVGKELLDHKVNQWPVVGQNRGERPEANVCND